MGDLRGKRESTWPGGGAAGLAAEWALDHRYCEGGRAVVGCSVWDKKGVEAAVAACTLIGIL